MKKGPTEYRVRGVSLDRITNEPTVLLTEIDGYNTISLDIGPFEARAIIVEMEGINTHAPLTHDLLAGFLRKHGYKMKSFSLCDRIGTNIIGRICYSKGFRTYCTDTRPSDGIALAVRLGAPIYISDTILPLLLMEQKAKSSENTSNADILYL